MANGQRLSIGTRVNGTEQELEIDSAELLIDVLRDRLNLTGTKRSCDVQICGTCTVQLDGAAVSACTTLAAEMDGRTVTTVEGLACEDQLSALQQAFVEEGAMQCGFCTSGFLMSATALLEESPDADPQTITDCLTGNICRCAGYSAILAAVLRAQREQSGAVS